MTRPPGLRRVPPPGAPRPLPPMPQWDGHSVSWLEWEPEGPVFLCPPPPGGNGCRQCRGVDLWSSTARTDAQNWSGRPAPSRVVARAARCAGCGHVEVFGLDPFEPACMLLCDDCDAVAAVGATFAEARRSLVVLGGWTGGPGTDWDRCPACAHDGVLRSVPRNG